MKYKIVLQKSEEGYSVNCPGLPGCWSQGETEAEALIIYRRLRRLKRLGLRW
jgi:predicted RNase H-like HicB family nuclease